MRSHNGRCTGPSGPRLRRACLFSALACLATSLPCHGPWPACVLRTHACIGRRRRSRARMHRMHTRALSPPFRYVDRCSQAGFNKSPTGLHVQKRGFARAIARALVHCCAAQFKHADTYFVLWMERTKTERVTLQMSCGPPLLGLPPLFISVAGLCPQWEIPHVHCIMRLHHSVI